MQVAVAPWRFYFAYTAVRNMQRTRCLLVAKGGQCPFALCELQYCDNTEVAKCLYCEEYYCHWYYYHFYHIAFEVVSCCFEDF